METNKAKEFIGELTILCNKYKILLTDFYISEIEKDEQVVCVYYLEVGLVESIKRKESVPHGTSS